MESFRTWAEEVAELPLVVLPSAHVNITECADKLFRLIGPTKTMFCRGGAVTAPVQRDDGMLALDILRPAAARSAFEKHAKLGAWRSGANGQIVLKPTTCPHDMADALLQSEEARTLLPRVEGLVNCPIIRDVDGVPVIAELGYDEHTRLLVTGGSKPEAVERDAAVTALLDLLSEFDFQSPADKSRAIASLITPALKMGGYIHRRVPADVAEADQSQSGKTFRQKVLAAIYNERLSLITNRDGGVGSVDESLNQQLIAGRPFIQFDNFRGRFSSPHLEAFLTSEGAFPCRVPHRGEVMVPAENFFVLLTSNGVDTTRDFANRSNIIRIRKKRSGFAFRTYPEGDLLAHVRARQPFYLGCVFAVIREWHRAGKPRSAETGHDFRDWVQVVDWIVQNLFGAPPVMEGHREAQERVSNPAQVWIRSVALVAEQTGESGKPLTATEIHSLCDSNDISIPGLRAAADEDKAKRVIGSIMAKLFRDSDTLDVDGYRVAREEHTVARNDVNAGGGFKSKTYTFLKL